MQNLFQDVRYAVRMLVRNPGFTIVAVCVLALAIGGNTAMFSVVNALALRPLAVKNPDELVGCYSKKKGAEDRYRGFSFHNYRDIRDGADAFSSLMAYTVAMVGMSEGDTTRRTFASMVSANYFSTLGVRLAAGRTFTVEEEQPGSGAPVAVVSHSYWRRHGADPSVVGRTIRINNHDFTVIGIAPEQFTGTAALFSPEVWLPLGVYEMVANDFSNEEKRSLGDRNNHCLMLVGRLSDGMSAVDAEARLKVVADGLEAAYPAENKDQELVLAKLPRLSISTSPRSSDNLGTLTVVLMSMSGVVLLIACLNLANMLLARGTARRKEIAIRIALGGGRARIVRQLLTEGLVLSLAGGMAGLFLSYWGTELLARSLAPRLPFMNIEFDATPDWRVLLAMIGSCVVCTLVFGFGPAWKLSRSDVQPGLKEQAAGEAQSLFGRSLFSPRNLVVIGQMALSLALLVCAGLFMRSAIKASQADPGFSMESGVLVELDAALAGYDEGRGRRVYATLIERLRALPGVDSAALAYVVPFGVFSDTTSVSRAGEGENPGNEADPNTDRIDGVHFNIITSDYFKTLNLPLVRGREFDRLEAEASSGSAVAIIDDVLAEKLWPGEDPIGRHIELEANKRGANSRAMQVIGVVPSVRNDLSDNVLRPHIYVPCGPFYRSQMNVHLKTTFRERVAESAFLKTVRKEIRNVDAELPVLSMRTLWEFRKEGLLLWMMRTAARLFTLFGGLALLLAVIGVYGVKSYVVARRTHEIGIRMALGASRCDVLWMMLREGFALTFVGLGIGVLLALAVGRVLGSVLFEVRGADPLVLATAPLLLGLAALLACYIPARRASRIEPMKALRWE